MAKLVKLAVIPRNARNEAVDSKLFTVLFNPASLSISKTVNWTPATLKKTESGANCPPLSFGGGGSRTLSLELFYDVTEPMDIENQREAGTDGLTFVDDVRTETDRMVALTRIDPELGRPPAVTIEWGGKSGPYSDLPFTGVVSSLTQRFTYFSESGKPLRAELSVSLTEFWQRAKRKSKKNSQPKTLKTKQKQSVHGNLSAAGRDQKDWRPTAKANNLDDPRNVPPNKTLVIPPEPRK